MVSIYQARFDTDLVLLLRFTWIYRRNWIHWIICSVRTQYNWLSVKDKRGWRRGGGCRRCCVSPIFNFKSVLLISFQNVYVVRSRRKSISNVKVLSKMQRNQRMSDNRHESFVELTPVLMLVFSVYGVIEKINCSITIEFRLLVVSIPYSSSSLCGMKYTSLKLKKFPILVL